MSKVATDTFNVPELYLLAAAFGGNVLFGLPEKQIYQLRGEEVFADAHHRLIEKEIITEEGKITKAGAIIIQAIEYYHQSKKYVRINNLMFAFIEGNDDELIVLVEVEEQKLYKLYVMSKAIILKLLLDKFSVISREPEEDEKTFLTKELNNEQRHEIENFEPGDSLLNIEFFHVNETNQQLDNPSFYQQWLAFPKDKKLITVDTVKRKFYHTSQYWFLKMIFDELEFPYKEAN